MITKQIAATLYSYDYKLVDKEGLIYPIKGVFTDQFGDCALTLIDIIEDEKFDLVLKYIGTDYFILARQMSDLTKNIEGVGVPIFELLKIATDVCDLNRERIKNIIVAIDSIQIDYRKGFNEICFAYIFEDSSFVLLKEDKTMCIHNQESLFQWLDTNHFLRGVDESLIKYI